MVLVRGGGLALLLAIALGHGAGCSKSGSTLQAAATAHCEQLARGLRMASTTVARGHPRSVTLGVIGRDSSDVLYNIYSFCAGIRTQRPSTIEFHELSQELSELPAELDADSAEGKRARAEAGRILTHMADLADATNQLPIAD